MGVRYQWDNTEKTVLRYLFDPVWTWDELRELINRTNDEIDRVGHDQPIMVIYDTPPDMRLPSSFITNVINLARLKRHPRADLIIIARSNYVFAMLETTLRLARTVRMDFMKVVRDESSAQAMIASPRIEQE